MYSEKGLIMLGIVIFSSIAVSIACTGAVTSRNNIEPIGAADDFECYKDGLYQNKENCSRFIQCSNGKAYHMPCPRKTHFSVETQRCESPCNAYCDQSIACKCGWPSCMNLDGCLPRKTKLINPYMDGMEGDIYSPGYLEGLRYPDNLKCQYTVKAPAGFRILLKFVELDIEPFDFCNSDLVAVFEGDSVMNPAHGVFCGNETYPDIVSRGSALHILFQTNFMIGRKGFHLKYKTSPSHSLCPQGSSICRNRKCYIGKCDGVDECGDGSDEERCGFPLLTTTCGIRRNDSFNEVSPDRVVGGQEAIPHSWPWQADLQLEPYYPNSHMCGGTLINAQWVVTAGHCVRTYSHPLQWRVHLGNHHKFQKDRYEQVRYVERIIAYPNLTGNGLLSRSGEIDVANHDIALMKLNAPVAFTDQVRPACLPKQGDELKLGTKCMATGWGNTRGTGSSTSLKEVAQYVKDSKACHTLTGAMNNKTMICVSGQKENNAVCHGDSGGPLVCKINGNWNVMGAASRITGHTFQQGLCGVDGSNAIFTKIADKIEWVQNMIDTYSD